MKKETRNYTSYAFDFSEQDGNDYALREYGIKVKDRSKKRKQDKFSEKKVRDNYEGGD